MRSKMILLKEVDTFVVHSLLTAIV